MSDERDERRNFLASADSREHAWDTAEEFAAKLKMLDLPGAVGVRQVRPDFFVIELVTPTIPEQGDPTEES